MKTNREGLTYAYWRLAAKAHDDTPELRRAWAAGEDPTEHRAAREREERDPTPKPKKLSAKAADKLISRLYTKRCSGIQIPIMELNKIRALGLEKLRAGCSEDELGDAIAAYVETIREDKKTIRPGKRCT